MFKLMLFWLWFSIRIDLLSNGSQNSKVSTQPQISFCAQTGKSISSQFFKKKIIEAKILNIFSFMILFILYLSTGSSSMFKIYWMNASCRLHAVPYIAENNFQEFHSPFYGIEQELNQRLKIYNTIFIFEDLKFYSASILYKRRRSKFKKNNYQD